MKKKEKIVYQDKEKKGEKVTKQEKSKALRSFQERIEEAKRSEISKDSCCACMLKPRAKGSWFCSDCKTMIKNGFDGKSF